MSQAALELLLLVALATSACGGQNHGGSADAPGHPSTASGEEPITFHLTDWWSSAAAATVTATWRHEELAAPSGSCTLEVDRWWGLPPDTGGPAHVESSRPVVVDGVALSVDTMSLFEGTTQKVDTLYVDDGKAHTRLVFRGCAPAEVDTVLASAKLSPSVKAAPRH
jgi:hypothetical protein